MRSKQIIKRLALLLLSLLLSAAVIVCTSLIAVVLSRVNPGKLSESNYLNAEFLTIYTSFCIIAAISALYIWRKMLSGSYMESIPEAVDPVFQKARPHIPLKTYAGYLILIAVLSFTIHFVNTRLFFLPDITPWQKTMITSARGSTTDMLLLLLSTSVLAPIWEELIFRGLIFSGFRLILPTNITIILSSLCWSLAHMSQYNSIIISEILIIGIILGVSRNRTASLRIPVFIHIVNNLIAFINLYLYSISL